MATSAFKETLHAEAPDGAIDMRPSPYVKWDALATPTGSRALRLIRALGGRPSVFPQFHLTPSRARKAFRLFFCGFDVREAGAHSYAYIRNGSGPMNLSTAISWCKAMDLK